MPVLFSCLKIFFCRILDVSLSTVKTVLTVKEETKLAAICGFFEVFIWYIVVKDALTGNAPMLATAVSYAGGYAAGTYVGGLLSRHFVSGQVTMQVITSSRDMAVIDALRHFGYGLSVVNVNEGISGKERYMIFSTIDKRRKASFEEMVKKTDPGAFIIVQNTHERVGGYEKAKILNEEDYLKSMQLYAKARRGHLFINETRLASSYMKEFGISYTQAVSIIRYNRKDCRRLEALVKKNEHKTPKQHP